MVTGLDIIEYRIGIFLAKIIIPVRWVIVWVRGHENITYNFNGKTIAMMSYGNLDFLCRIPLSMCKQRISDVAYYWKRTHLHNHKDEMVKSGPKT